MDKIDYIVLQIVENTIPIGINLQSQCNGKGVYIDSFYRNNNGELLPAELCESLSIGDKLMFINEKAVQDYDLKTVIKLISTSIRPLKLEFKALTLAQPVKDVVHQRDTACNSSISNSLNASSQMGISFDDSSDISDHMKIIEDWMAAMALLRDVRTYNMMDDFLTFSCSNNERVEFTQKLALLKSLDFLLDIYFNATSELLSEKILRKLHSLKVSDIKTSGSEHHASSNSSNNMVSHAKSVMESLLKELETTYFKGFYSSIYYRKLVAFLMDSPNFVFIPIREVIHSTAFSPYLYVFLSQSNSHELYKRIIKRLKYVGSEKKQSLAEILIKDLLERNLLNQWYASRVYQLLLYELETPDGDEQTIRYISGNSIVNDSGQQSNSIDKFSLAKGYLQRLLQLELPRSFSKHILSTKKSSPVVEEFNSDSFGYIFDFYFDGKQTVFGNAKSLYYLGGDPAFLSREDFYSDDCRSNNGERVNIKLKQEYSTFVIVNPTLTWNVKDTVDSEPPLPKLVSFVLPKECLDNSREDFESSNDNKTKSKARAFSSSNLYGCTLIMYKRSENQTNVSNSPSNNEYSTNLSDDAGASSLPCKEVDSQTKNSTAADRSFIQDFMHKTEAVVSKQLWVDVTTNLSTVLTHGTAVASNYTNRFSFSHSFRSSNSTDDSLNNGVELKELPRTNKTTSNRNSFCENKDKDSSDSTRSTIMYSTSTTLHGSTEDMQQQLGKDNSSPKISLKTVLDITFSEQSSRTSNSSRQSSPDTNVGPVRYETFGTCILTDKPLILSLKLLLADVMLNSSDLPEAFAGSAFLTKDQQIQRLEQQVLSTDLEQGKSLSDMFINTSAKEYRYDAVMEIDVDILLEAIRPSNLVVLFLAAVLEYKIIFLSAISSSSLLVVAEWLKLMMQPLEWCHIYAPTAPESITIPLMHCPTPYVIGLNTKSFDNYAYSYYLKNDEELLDSIGDVVVLDIDADIISLSDSLAEIEPIGHLLVDRVAAIAKPSLLYADSLQSALHMAASLPRNKTASMVSSADSNVPASNRDDKAIDNVSRDQTNKPRKYRSTKTKNYRLSKVFHNFVKDLLLPIDNACVTFGDEQETVVVMDEANLHNGNATVNNRSNTKKTNKGKNSFVATEFYNSKFYPIFMERFLRTQTLSNYITTKFE